MNILVTCDLDIVFTGKAEDFLIENQNDEDIKEILQECYKTGRANYFYLSGHWEIIKLEDKINL